MGKKKKPKPSKQKPSIAGLILIDYYLDKVKRRKAIANLIGLSSLICCIVAVAFQNTQAIFLFGLIVVFALTVRGPLLQREAELQRLKKATD